MGEDGGGGGAPSSRSQTSNLSAGLDGVDTGCRPPPTGCCRADGALWESRWGSQQQEDKLLKRDNRARDEGDGGWGGGGDPHVGRVHAQWRTFQEPHV